MFSGEILKHISVLCLTDTQDTTWVGYMDTQEAEIEGLQVQGLPGLQSEFKVSLGNLVEPCLKMESRKTAEAVQR